jgi:hypothetical protein
LKRLRNQLSSWARRCSPASCCTWTISGNSIQ